MVLSGLIFIGIMLAFVGLRINMSAGAQGTIQSRLSQYAGTVPDRAAQKETEQAWQRENAFADRMDEALQKSKYTSSLKNDLQRADIKLRPSEFIMINIGATIVLAIVGLLVRDLIGALIFGIIGFMGPRIYLKMAIGRRLSTFNNQLGDTITMMANALRAGLGMSQVMARVGEEAPSPTRDEFTRVIREIQIGLPVEMALQNMVNRLHSEDLDLMVTAILINREVGGSLANILDLIGETIRERMRIKGEIKTLTAQQQLSGYIISLLPVVLAIALYLINPTYMNQMFVVPWVCMPICAGIGIIFGFIVMQQILKIEV
jgi:tight adherence protein B